MACTVSVAAQSGSGGTRPPGTTTSTTTSAAESSQGSIRGRVVLGDGTPFAQSIRITVMSLRGTQDVVFTDSQGLFDIRGLTSGEYTVEAEGDRLKYDVSSERVQVYKGAPSIVTIILREKAADVKSRPGNGVISVGEMDKDVPADARKEFERASHLSKDGKNSEAIDHLKKAIDIYPNFMMAHNDLGAQFLERGDLDEATAELRRAIEIDAKAFNPYLNLGIVFLRQQRFAEAADTLRKALSLESNSPAAKLYLGLALKGMDELDEAERELKAAYNLGGAAYAAALFHLGEVYMDKGERELARQALETFLHDAPTAPNAAQARKLIGQLQ
ncbi:MAG: tetratricopeptide repeat protein [Acidobacteriota bacterium]|nr:tetratricopeptide repeat protein [Acidobacteriota bacterium]